MALKKLKPTSAGTRHAELIDRRVLSKVKPTKSLTKNVHRAVGRNNKGRITTRHKGAGAKKKYRTIDFTRDKRNISCTVETIEYDPNRSAFIALVKYQDGERRYILAPDGIKVGESLISSETAPIKPGNAMPLSKVPQGMFVHAVELQPGQGAQIARSAGTSIQVMGGTGGYAQLKLPSGEYRLVRETCYATVGIVSNTEQKNIKLGKAGRSRRKGIRPSVRGVAMSIKHPHGGGQGKGGRHGSGGPKKDFWGNKVGVRTRRNKRTTSKYIIKRRPAKNKFKSYKTIV